jgi:hypothetical protein
MLASGSPDARDALVRWERDLGSKRIAITARHVTKVGNTRSQWPNPWEGAVEGRISDWDEVVTR